MTDRRTVSNGSRPAWTLDLRGLRCPLPVLKIAKALKLMEPGAELEALCDDPLAAVDVPNLVREDGHALVETATIDGALRFRIRRRAVEPLRD